LHFHSLDDAHLFHYSQWQWFVLFMHM
jgi:hypothetical protein